MRWKIDTKKSQYNYYDVVIGEFDSEVCRKCGEVFFTEAAPEEIDRRAKDLGLWGMEQRTKISYSGNSMIVRIPKRMAEFLSLEKGREVILHPEGKNRLVVEIPE